MDNDKYTLQDLVGFTIDQQPIEFEKAFSDVITDRIADAIDNRKIELAQSIFAGQEPEMDQVEDAYDDDSEEEEYDGEDA